MSHSNINNLACYQWNQLDLDDNYSKLCDTHTNTRIQLASSERCTTFYFVQALIFFNCLSFASASISVVYSFFFFIWFLFTFYEIKKKMNSIVKPFFLSWIIPKIFRLRLRVINGNAMKCMEIFDRKLLVWMRSSFLWMLILFFNIKFSAQSQRNAMLVNVLVFTLSITLHKLVWRWMRSMRAFFYFGWSVASKFASLLHCTLCERRFMQSN